MGEKKSRLHPVIKVKKFKEKKTHGELVQIQALREKENTTLNDLNMKKVHALDETVHTFKVRATEVQASRAFIEKLSQQIQQQEKKIQGMRVQEENKRGELSQKSQERKMVEKLDEKRKATIAQEIERKEQRVLDVLSRRLSFGL